MNRISPSVIINRLEAGTLARKTWTGTDSQGRETACLLAAIWPQCGEEGNAFVCPATLMPQWLAYLTPWIDDSPSDEAWPGIVRRYADLAGRWHILDDAAWNRLDFKCRAIAVREAMSHTKDEEVLKVSQTVVDLCEQVVSGKEVAIDQWAEAAAADAADAAAAAAAAVSAAWATSAAARAAAREAAMAAWPAREAAETARASSDRMIGLMLDAIEAEIVAATK